jgi:agmatine deiminase
MGPIPWVYGEMVRKLFPHELVRILVNSEGHEAECEGVLIRLGVDLHRVDFVRIPTNRAWARDTAPYFMKRRHPSVELAIAGFGFNAWAKYPDWAEDAAVSVRVAEMRGLHRFSAMVDAREVVLEGGSMEVNGQGTLMTTEQCLLDRQVQARNPNLSRGDLEKVMRDMLGVSQVLWLGSGIHGDDTHGHIDDFCRFVGPSQVVINRTNDIADVDYRPLEENWERLADMRVENGAKIEVIALPTPAPLYCDGERLPASYANFYIGNRRVLVPTFNDPNDRKALGILAEIFPNREVVGIHAVDMVWGYGTVHCATREEPTAE